MKRITKIYIDDFPPEIIVRHKTEMAFDYIRRVIVTFWLTWFQALEDVPGNIEVKVSKVEVSGYLAKPISKALDKMNKWFQEQLLTYDADGRPKMYHILKDAKMHPEKFRNAENIIYDILSAGEIKP